MIKWQTGWNAFWNKYGSSYLIAKMEMEMNSYSTSSIFCDLGQNTCNGNHLVWLQLPRGYVYNLREDQVALYLVKERTQGLSEDN